MRLQDDIDFTTLNWVKQELDETLKQARQALEAYVDDPADSSLMRFCATYLHQVQGTLRMVELYGASMVVEEMERLAQTLLDGEIRQKEEAYSVLMRGIVQLPDYLERLQSGHKDIPIVLLPLLNDLRAVRGEELFTESVLFSPDLNLPLPASANGAVTAYPEGELKLHVGRLRTAYQVSLLKLLRAGDPRSETGKLSEILGRVLGISYALEARRVWWIAMAVLEGVGSSAIEPSPAVKLLFGKVDREIKRLVDAGEGVFQSAPPRELLKNLLYYVAHANGETPRLTDVRNTFRLQSLLPSQKELEHAKGSISGHNRALLDTVSLAIKDDLLRVKEALDIFLRAQGNDPGELMAQVDVLDRVGDTLGMLGLGVPRRVVTEQRTIVEEIANKARSPDESTLLDVAGALLYVEASLDDHIERLGADTPEDTGSGGMELPKAEVRKILDALMKEATSNLAQAKNDIVAFIESPWDHAKVEQIPRLLDEVSGALRMLDLNRPAELMHGLVRFIEVELLRWRRVPTAEQMDKLADTIASIEYYLEATRDQRAGREKILDVTRESLEALGYWPVPEDEGDAPEPPPTRAAVPTPAPAPAPVPESAAPRSGATPLPPSVGGFGLQARDEPAAPAASLSLDPIAPSESRAADLSIGQFVSFAETLPDRRSQAGRQELEFAAADSDLPSVEMNLGSQGEVDEYVARLGLPDVAEPVAEPPPAAEPAHELEVAVEIAPGEGLDALVVGDHSSVEHGDVQDLTGLKFTETEPTLPPEPIALVAPVAAAAPVVVPAAPPAPRYRTIEIEEEIEEEVEDNSPAGGMSDASFQAVASDDIDEEIREVFVEEVQEEIENLNRHMPLWKADLHDFERLKPVRRSFHTLKGSGRLVGAMALGEFSWKVENMLNRVLDKTIQPNTAAITLVDQAVAALPELLAALRGEGAPTSDIAGIMGVADKLVAGEEAWLAPARKRTRLVKRKVKRLVEVPVEEEIAAPVVAAAPALVAAPVELTRTLDLDSQVDSAPALAEVDADALPSFGPLPNIDPVLFDILRSEVSQHLSIIDSFVASSAHTPQVATDTLLRSVHTLHGAIAMVDIPVISHVLAPLEGYIKRLRARDAAPQPVGLAALADASSLVREVMLSLERGQLELPASDALVERIIALRDDLPEPELAHTLYVPSDDDGLDLLDIDAEDEAHAAADAAEEASAVSALAEEASAIAAASDDATAGFDVEEISMEEAMAFTPQAEQLIQPEAPAQMADAPARTPADFAAFDEPAIELSLDQELALSLDNDLAANIPSAATAPADDSLEEVEELSLDDLARLDFPELQSSADDIDNESISLAQDATPAADAVALDSLFSSDEQAQFEAMLASVAPVESRSAFDHEIKLADLAAPDASLAYDASELDALLSSAADAEADAAAQAEADAERARHEAEAAARAEMEAAAERARVEAQARAEAEAAERAAAELADRTRREGERERLLAEMAASAQRAEAERIAAAAAERERADTHARAVAAHEVVLPPIADDPQADGKLDLPDMDEDLLEIFVQEGSDILDHSDGLIARLREAPHDREIVTGMQRDLHTLKGGARMAGLAPIGDLSHAMESLLEAISEGRRGMDRTTVESFERGYDRLHALVQRIAKRQAIAMPENAIARFEALVSGDLSSQLAAAPLAADADAAVPAAVAGDSADTAPAAAAAPAVEALAPKPPLRPAGPLRPAALPIEEDEPRPAQEMIRVRSDLLDSLVNYAGEVSIYRSRLEQQVTTFRFNLVEFEQTVARLREQLRKLEMETEAQIIARYQREHHEPGETTFDPLELDRFSQLQQLSRALGESVSDLVSIQNLLDDLTRQSETLLLQQSRVSSDLQEGLMRTRMVPFDSLVPSLRRTVRQAAQEIGKRAQLKVEGAQGEMDRNLLERMKAPFEHMLRNALAHGVEPPEERLRSNKNPEGTVTIQVSREATEVVLRVSDDGRGMDRDAIRRKAIERGLLNAEAQLSDRDLYAFILETGFSTAEQVTQLAGRGVGMDVVHNEIKQLGGSLTIDSERGKGSVFTIRLPFTLAVTQAILVRLGDAIYAIPMSSVQGVVRIGRDDLDRRLSTANPIYAYAGEEFHIYELSQLLNVPVPRIVDEAQVPLLMTRTGDQRAAVRIDGVVGSREVVVKSVGPQISSVAGIFGATIMGDGSVVMILDLAPLVRRYVALRAASVEAGVDIATFAPQPVAPPVEERRQPLVMVVDDSITMRKVTTRVLERNDMDVITAKDGLDAVEKLQDKVPDLMLLDIEMPRMDGYELATYMKNDPRLKLVPIIMITSRTGEKHRQRALEIGVERYLGKPYQEVDLLRNVQETLRLSRA
ncbi:chemosensory pili system protein ChpA (sensor histidine kinase/response regulator) [Tahibacter aquaticus]|uniref:Chemotaxis protein CheA n=1 Tax=Tahibacter aquaticus TaxID=520092 RepID=A0A4R6YQ20_9GAMM|nr:Hpt domain-containing protein [Tahibacter aquaticus]TDR39729.1 chemosensory pili system protein ChpA (sensor histidine kinase/response regulator) [Tahibacter aquaticus]